jgi:hypothetical protein
MASIPILCEYSNHRISPSTALKAVGDKIFCEPCSKKLIEGSKIEENPEAHPIEKWDASLINYHLAKAGWTCQFTPQDVDGRVDPFAKDSYIWWNGKSNPTGFSRSVEVNVIQLKKDGF